MIPTISLEELRAKMDRNDDFTLVEVLAPAKYRKGHLPGAISVPYTGVERLAARRLPDKNKEIVVYCGAFTWPAGERAARALQKLGYANVKDYKGGKAEWMEQGLPIEESPPQNLWERFVDWLG